MRTAEITFGQLDDDEHIISIDNHDNQQAELVPVDPARWDSLTGSTAERIAHILDWTETEHDGEFCHDVSKSSRLGSRIVFVGFAPEQVKDAIKNAMKGRKS